MINSFSRCTKNDKKMRKFFKKSNKLNNKPLIKSNSKVRRINKNSKKIISTSNN